MTGSSSGSFSLVAATDAHFAAMAQNQAPDALAMPDDGVENRDVIEMLGALARRIRPQIDPAAWLIVWNGEVVGLCSITKAFASTGVLEIGYGIAPQWRNRGFATRAVAMVLDAIGGDPRVESVVAETAGDNVPSQRTLEKNGFKRTGLRNDPEDGVLICWQAALR